MTSSSSVSRLQTPPSPIRLLAPLEESQVAGKDSLQRPQTQCSSRPHTQSQQLQMSSSVSTLPSPIATPPSSHGNRPFTSSSRPLTRSGLETITPPSVVFPTSNTDTIPSSNSAIVKYKTSRDYMLDTLALPSKEQRDKALKRSIERGSPLPLKGSQQQTQTQPTRYDTKANPLAKIAIAPDKG